MAPDISALGRLSESLDGGRRTSRRAFVRRGSGPARRRPRVPRPVWAGVVLVVLGLVWLGMVGRDAGPQTEPVELPAVAGRGLDDAAARASRMDRRAVAPAFARVDALELVLPVEDAELVAFGEAQRADALALLPVGRLLAAEHPRFETVRDRRGPGYVVLAPRGRPRPPTSGVDVAARPGSAVHAPVSGQVVDVREYALAGGGRDLRVVLQPDTAPSLHVVVTHIAGTPPAPGDHVTAGRSPIGTVRPLPHARGIDEHLDGDVAHLHVEVTPARAPEPADPNEPAAPPERPHG